MILKFYQILMIKKDIENLEFNHKEIKELYNNMNKDLKNEIEKISTSQNKMLWSIMGGLGVTLLTLVTLLLK
jgi:phage-related protein